MPTLASVSKGIRPQPDLVAVAKERGGGLYEIEIGNRGDGDARLDIEIRAGWKGGSAVASDSLSGFRIAADERNALVIRGPQSRITGLISPGENRIVAWFRLRNKSEVRVNVSRNR
jgi:hypothetical protein